MTTMHAEIETTTGHPYANPDFDSLPQTPNSAPGQSVWSQLTRDFGRLCTTSSATKQYARWRQRHGWRAYTPAELVNDLRDDPHGLGAVVSYYQSGSKLAVAILVEAFRPALITFTRYARLEVCEQIDRAELRAQAVLVTFYDVASTTNPQSLSIAGRLYGETLKRVTRQHPQVTQYPCSGWDIHEKYEHRRHPPAHTAKYRGRRIQNRPATVDVAPVATHPSIDWDAVEHKGLVRDLITHALDAAVISQLEYELVCGRFLGDTLVPVPTLALTLGQSVSYCETKIRRALAKLRAHYSAQTHAVGAAA